MFGLSAAVEPDDQKAEVVVPANTEHSATVVPPARTETTATVDPPVKDVEQ